MSSNYVNIAIAATLTGVSLGLALFVLYKSATQTDKKESAKHEKGNSKQTSSNSRNKNGPDHDGKTNITSEQSQNGHNDNVNSVSQSKEKNANPTGQGEGQQANVTGTAKDTGIGVVTTSDGYTVIKLSVPKEMVGAIIGRQGHTVKQIQSETKTKIDFGKQDSEVADRVITIRGSEKGTQDAELKILYIVYGQPKKDIHKIQVPQKCLGYIIGKGGETIKRLQSDSGCGIMVHSDRKEAGTMADVTLTGNAEQISNAVFMINEIVEEWKAKQSKAEFVKDRPSRMGASRRPRSVAVLPGSPLPCEVWPQRADYVECYVTATEDPSHVWVQLLTPAAAKLEEINAQLTNLYSNSAQLTDDVVANRPAVGTIVAARNLTDNTWYRGEISAYNDEDTSAIAVDIYYVDFGDSSWAPFENYNIQLLRPQFYDLPAQAIECYTDLALNTGCAADWTEEVCDLFDGMCHIGGWSVLMGCLVSRKLKTGEDFELPVIKLVDTNTQVDINITEEIKKAVGSREGAGPLVNGIPMSTNIAGTEVVTTSADPTTADPTTADPSTADPNTANTTTADTSTADPTTAQSTVHNVNINNASLELDESGTQLTESNVDKIPKETPACTVEDGITCTAVDSQTALNSGVAGEGEELSSPYNPGKFESDSNGEDWD